eukprot:3939557-Amphidinium_carterae.1
MDAAARTEILAKALGKARTDAVLPLATLLRAWAAEGKAYKGHTFTSQEVEAAIAKMKPGLDSKLDSARASPSSNPEVESAGSRCLVTITSDPSMKLDDLSRLASTWPPEKLKKAVVATTQSYGKGDVPVQSLEPAVRSVLQSLYEERKQPTQSVACDLQIIAKNSHNGVCAHSFILQAVCHFFECR